jgi:DNA-binding XRE family transcriptional regulator
MNEQHRSHFSKDTFDRMISEKLRLIRTEARLTQEQMAEIIGLSKKTLVQVEKERKTLGFTAAALVGILFRDSEIIQAMFGESVLDIVALTAFEGIQQENEDSKLDWIGRAKTKARYKSMGKRVWWKDEKVGEAYVLQSHILTGHLRIIDRTDALHYYNVDREEAETRFSALENSAKME